MAAVKKILVLACVIAAVNVLYAKDTTDVRQQMKAHLVSIDAEDAHLPSILAILAEESGFNIVTGPNVNQEDRISIHLSEVPIEQAVNLVVRAAGLSYEIVGNSFLVARSDRLKEEVGVSSYVIPLKYANATEVKDLLVNLTEEIEVDKAGNNLLVNTSPKKIAEIIEIVEKIDIPALQIMLEARLIEVAVADEQKLGIDWNKLSKLTTILAETGEPPFPGAGSLVPGVSFEQGDNDAVKQDFSPLATGRVPDQMYFQRIKGFDNVGHFSRQLSAFDVTLDFLLKNNRADILANSQVTTLNGREAQISMVDIVPYILSSGGIGGQVQVQREEVGIKLHILPTVNTDGYITVTVTPEVSSIFDFIGPDRNIPWVKRRISTTTIRVRDNESIVIAGLLGVDRVNTIHKVPILGDIPWLGKKLFQHKEVVDKKTDLIIEITPMIIEDNYSGIIKKTYMEDLEQSVIPGNPEDSVDEDDDPEEMNKSDEKPEENAGEEG